MSERTDWQDGQLKVVISVDKNISIWPATKRNPDGWEDLGFTGDRQACAEFINNYTKDQLPSLQIDK